MKTRHLSLEVVNSRIARLERQQNGGYSAEVARAFPLGRVGGSGRNVAAKNRRLDREIEGTIKRAGLLTALYARRNVLTNPRPTSPTVKRPKQKRASLFLDEERLFIAPHCTGFAYTDCHREKNGDFVLLAFMSYRTLELELEPRIPACLLGQVQKHAAEIQSRRGQSYPIAGNMSITLGS